MYWYTTAAAARGARLDLLKAVGLATPDAVQPDPVLRRDDIRRRVVAARIDVVAQAQLKEHQATCFIESLTMPSSGITLIFLTFLTFPKFS